MNAWNQSRRLASLAVSVVDDTEPLSVADVSKENPKFPFETERDVANVVENLDAESHEERVDKLQRIINAALTADDGEVPKPDGGTAVSSPESGNHATASDNGSTQLTQTDQRESSMNQLTAWNTARSISSNVVAWYRDEDDLEYEALQDKYPLLPSDESIAEAFVSEVEAGNYPLDDDYDDDDLVTKVARPVKNWLLELDKGGVVEDTGQRSWVEEVIREKVPSVDVPADKSSPTSEGEDGPGSEISPLEAWNRARSVSSAVVSWYESGGDPEEYSTVRSEYPILPDDGEEARVLVERNGGQSMAKKDLVTELAHKVKDWLLDGSPSHPSPEEEADGESMEDESVEETTEMVSDNGESVATEIEEDVEDQSLDEEVASVGEVGNEGKEEEEEEEEEKNDSRPTIERTATPSQGRSEPLQTEEREVAEALYETFHGKEERYIKVEKRYADVEFPHRSVALKKVVNAGGGTKDKKIRGIKQWVQMWWDDAEAVAELDKERRKPMGYSGMREEV